MTITPTAVQDAFPTIFDLRATHTALLAKQRHGATLGDLAGDVREFVRRAQITGAILDADEQRDAAQGLIDYWVTSLYRASVDVADEATLVDFDPSLAPALDDSLCPYVGLSSFREEDSKRFFGRKHMVALAMERIRGLGFLAVAGPSGSGKSSIVLGGVLPALKSGALEGSAGWRYLPPIVPGSNPLKNLAEAWSGGLQPAEEGRRAEARPSTGTDVAKKLMDDHQALSKIAGDTPLVVTIDQLEELFTLCDDVAAREAFVNNLVSLVSGARGHVVIVTMRSDYESRLATHPELQQLFEQGDVRATPLTAAELREAIEEPARQVGLKFESGVVDALIRDVLGEPAALPLLQFTLWKLWQSRDRNRITLAAYRKLGGGRAALATSANTLYEELIQQDRDTMRRILLRMVRPAAGAEVTSSRVRVQELLRLGDDPNRVQRVLDKLVAGRLVRYTGEEQVEVAHEALIRNWPLLVSWLEHKRAEMIELRRFESLAHEWERFGRSSGFLDEEQLKDAKRWLQRTDAVDLSISEALLALVDASAREIALRKHEQRRARVVGIGMAVMILLGVAWFVFHKLVGEARERAEIQANARVAAEQVYRDQLLAEVKKAREAEAAAKKAEAEARLYAEEAEKRALDLFEAEQARKAAEERAKQAAGAAEAANDALQEVYKQPPPAAPRPVAAPQMAAPPTVAFETFSFSARHRPLGPGVSIGNEYGSAGSACCIVRDAKGTRYLLTLATLLGKSAGGAVLQPSRPDGGGKEDVIGIVARVDGEAALVELRDGIRFDGNVPGVGALAMQTSMVQAGESVRMIGRGAGIVRGKVSSVRRNGFDIVIPAEAATPNSLGALVINERNQPVGLVSSAANAAATVLPLAPMLRELGVTLVR